MDRTELEVRLDAALLTDEEMAAGPETWVAFPDPFADMFRDAEDRQAEEERAQDEHHHHERHLAVTH